MTAQATLLCQTAVTPAETQQQQLRPRMQRRVLPVAQPGRMQVTLAAQASQHLQHQRYLPAILLCCVCVHLPIVLKILQSFDDPLMHALAEIKGASHARVLSSPYSSIYSFVSVTHLCKAAACAT